MHKNCEKCGLKNEPNRTFCMGGYGPKDAEVLLVGEGPGYEEDKLGRPFVGRAGQLLRKEWKDILGSDLDDVFLTNVVRCRPPGNRTPFRAEIKQCEHFLWKDIERAKPKLVVAVGNPAMHTIGIKGKITQQSGKPHTTDKGYTIIPLVHPSYVLQSPRQIQLFRRNLKSIRKFLAEGHEMDLGRYFIVKIED